MLRFALTATALAAVTVTAARAEAAILFFNNRVAWQAAAGPATFTENFSSFATDTSFRTSAVSVNGGSIAQEGVNANFRNEIDVPPLLDPPPADPVASLFTNADGLGTQVRITFASLNSAFGFDSYINAPLEGATLEVYSGASLLGSAALPGAAGAFLGYALSGGDTATSVRFVSTTLVAGTGGEGFNIDDLEGVAAADGSAVPEPATLALMALGGVGMLGGRYRKRRRAAAA